MTPRKELFGRHSMLTGFGGKGEAEEIGSTSIAE